MPFYTGVGSRETPNDVLGLMHRIGVALAERGWILRSGNADGADAAFASGAASVDPSKVHLFLPWKSYNRYRVEKGMVVFDEATTESLDIVPQFVPHWNRCSIPVRTMLSRNVHQVLGEDVTTDENKSRLLICWTRGGQKVGGTATTIRCAEYYQVPVVNLAFPQHVKSIQEKLSL